MVEVRKYSSRHLEIKFVLPFAKKKVIKKDITYYIFTPEHLNVNSKTTSLESMRHKFRTHGRYGSPELTLDELIDANNRISPLTKIIGYVDSLKKGKSLNISDVEFTHETQAIVNILRHQLKKYQTKGFCLLKSKKIVELKDTNKRLEEKKNNN